jgi:hypothetical protein
VLSLFVAVASVIGLVCKFFGWLKIGHWALYPAIAVISFFAAAAFAGMSSDINFHIANRIASVIEESTKGTKDITVDAELFYKPADYGRKENTYVR